MDVRGEMKDDLDAFERRRPVGRWADISNHRPRTSAGKGDWLSNRGSHGVPRAGELLAQGGPDETGGAGDQSVHGRSSWKTTNVEPGITSRVCQRGSISDPTRA
jgi:hypothetical protein